MLMLLMIGVTFVLTFTLSLIYASHFEWTLHRYVMHRPLWFFMYPFRAHQETHHKIYKSDESYHYAPDRFDRIVKALGLEIKPDDKKITMALWNGLVIITFGPLPFYFVAYVFWDVWNLEILLTLILTSAATCIGYYCTYEYLHACMHDPTGRWFEKTWLFRRINGHHILHHRYMGKNFNVVLPLADLLLGTLLPRSKIRFPQVRGPSVPDLQPQMA